MSKESKIFLVFSLFGLVIALSYLASVRADQELRELVEGRVEVGLQSVDAETERLLDVRNDGSLDSLERDIIETDLRGLDYPGI